MEETCGGRTLGKLSSSWNDGAFLDVRGKSGDNIVGDEKGVWKARSLQRKPLGERWNPRSIELVKFLHYKVPVDPNADEDIPEVVRLNPEEVEAAQPDADFKTFPRNYHIRKEDLIRHGYTATCPGCMASTQENEPKDFARVQAKD